MNFKNKNSVAGANYQVLSVQAVVYKLFPTRARKRGQNVFLKELSKAFYAALELTPRFYGQTGRVHLLLPVIVEGTQGVVTVVLL